MQQIARESLQAFEIAVTEENLSVTVTGMDAAKITVTLTLWVPIKEKISIEKMVSLASAGNAEYPGDDVGVNSYLISEILDTVCNTVRYQQDCPICK